MKRSHLLPLSAVVVLVSVLSYLALRERSDSIPRTGSSPPPNEVPAPKQTPEGTGSKVRNESAESKAPGFDHREPNPGGEKERQLAREARRKAAERLQTLVPGTRVDFDDQLGSPKFV